MYENESPQGYYSVEEERYSQKSMEEHNYDAPVNYVQDAPYEEHNNAAPVNFESPFGEERIWTCKFAIQETREVPIRTRFHTTGAFLTSAPIT